MKRKLLVAGPVALVVVIALVAFLAWPRGGTAVTEDEALDNFRSDQSASTTSDDAGSAEGTEGPSAVDTTPTPGVYSFATTGQESVKLGPLPAETRDYPGIVPVTVTEGEQEGCFTVKLDLLAEHSEDTTYCTTDDDGLRLAAHSKRQTVGPMKPVATMACDEDVLIDPQATGETALTCSLTIDGGPAELSATVDGTVTARTAVVDVDGREVAAVQVDIVNTLSGDLTGTWNESLWFSEDDWLPLRIVRSLDMQGLAAFSETSDLTITTLDPAT